MIRGNKYIVEGLGEVVTSSGNLVTIVKDLGGRLISVRDEAYARIQTEGYISKSEGTLVSMVVSYLKGEYPVLEKKEIFPLGLAKRLVKANSQTKYYSTPTSKAYDRVREKAEKEEKLGIEPAKRTAIILPSRENFLMSSTNHVDEGAFIFEDMAKPDKKTGRKSYFQLYGSIEMLLLDADTVDGKEPNLLTAQNGTIQNYVWFGKLLDGLGSDLFGDFYRGADGQGSRSRGVVKKSAKGVSQKISALQLFYTSKQAKNGQKHYLL